MPVLRRGKLVTQTLERHALQDHAAGTCECCQEEAFSAEDRRPNIADQLHVVIHRRLEGDQVTSLHLQHFAGAKREIDVIAARMHEHGAGSGQFLENKSFAAQKSGAQSANHGDVKSNRVLREQETVALHQDDLPWRQLKNLDLARVMTRESDLSVTRTGAEVSEEQRFAHELALNRSDNLVPERLAGHASCPIHVGGFVHHLACFGVNLLAGFQVNAHYLEIVS